MGKKKSKSRQNKNVSRQMKRQQKLKGIKKQMSQEQKTPPHVTFLQDGSISWGGFRNVDEISGFLLRNVYQQDSTHPRYTELYGAVIETLRQKALEEAPVFESLPEDELTTVEVIAQEEDDTPQQEEETQEEIEELNPEEEEQQSLEEIARLKKEIEELKASPQDQ